MTIQIRLFAILRERTGISQTSLQLPDGATIDDASVLLSERRPSIADYLSRVAFAVNQNYSDRKTVLNDGDELALIPPVSGG